MYVTAPVELPDLNCQIIKSGICIFTFYFIIFNLKINYITTLVTCCMRHIEQMHITIELFEYNYVLYKSTFLLGTIEVTI